MKTIAFMNFKGGCGKTTLSINVAYSLKESCKSVLLIDADPMASTIKWHEKNDGQLLNVMQNTSKTIKADLKSLSSYYDYAIIDVGIQDIALIGSIIRFVDYVFIPMQPSQLDIDQTAPLGCLIKECIEDYGSKVKAYYIASRVITNTKLSKEINDAMSDFPLLKARTHSRMAYIESYGNGQTVFHTNDKKAMNEITSITDEILGLIKE